MPVFIAALLGGFISATSSFVGRVLLALGIGFVAYQGIDVALTALKASAVANLSALPFGLVGMLGVLKIGTGLNIIFSAITARLTIMGLTSGTIKRMVYK
jgi:hypothetical protein